MKDGKKVMNKKTYILGMAKSPLQVEKGLFGGVADKYTKSIKPGSSRSLELDFLRLVYATKELMRGGHEVHAYLMVTTDVIVEKIEKWRKKYEVEKGLVNIESASLNKDDIKNIVEEKNNNKTANTPTSENRIEGAKADNGRDIIEKKLKIHIEKNHGEPENNEEVKEMPFQIKWDYFREVK